jgi:hypothetical protein
MNSWKEQFERLLNQNLNMEDNEEGNKGRSGRSIKETKTK